MNGKAYSLDKKKVLKAVDKNESTTPGHRNVQT